MKIRPTRARRDIKLFRKPAKSSKMQISSSNPMAFSPVIMSPLPKIPIYNNFVRDTLDTVTVTAQKETENDCLEIYTSPESTSLGILQRDLHIKFLRSHLGKLPSGFVSLDASRPWLCYWSLNALALLSEDISDLKEKANNTISMCLSPTGGIGGNFGYEAHLAATYAGTNTLALTADEETLSKIDTQKFYDWLIKLKQPDGGFAMHIGGECDTRAVYCALSVASLLDILTPELIENTTEYLTKCQTFEGGVSDSPGTEAHGGYAFCALAALCIMHPPTEVHKYINIPKLLKWLSSRQHQPEGGFSGRTNKLVDGCYSHWVGGCWAILETITGVTDLWDREALQNYTLYCCQTKGKGGLRDKPGKGADAYHSNYTLCGLAGAQNSYTYDEALAKEKNAKLGDYAYFWKSQTTDLIEINEKNLVAQINPIHVLPIGVAESFHEYFVKKKLI